MGTANTTKTYIKKTSQTPPSGKHRTLLKWIAGIIGTLIILSLAVFIAFKVSPWPGALLIRYEFNKGGAKIAEAMAKHVPSGITEVHDQQYRPNDKDGYLDVFYPERTVTPLPTIVWVHGGAWVSGDKDDVDSYLKIVASYGYTVVGVNYSIAPGKKYPTPIVQANDALDYLQRNAGRLRIDPNRIVLAGDSAGSQVVAQLATIITNPSYADGMQIRPSLKPAQLKAMVLNCGAYDLNLPNYSGSDGWFLHTVLWAYSGTKDFLHDPKIRHASVVNYVTAQFPPSFLTAGNADPLEAQSKEMAAKLSSLGVPTTTLFYPHDHQPELPHEYQFDLDGKDGQHALTRIIGFLRTYTK